MSGDDSDDPGPKESGDDDTPRTSSRRDFLGTTVLAVVGLGVGCATESGVDAGAIDAGGRDAGARDAGRRDARVQLADAGAVPTEDAGAEEDGGVTPVESPESVAESAAGFPLGVASGDAIGSSAIFWTRYAGAAPLELVVWEMAGETYARVAHAGAVVPGEDGYTHVDVTTLTPGARHRFAFFETDAGARVTRSPIGRMRAALPEGALETLLIGAVSCTSNSRSIETIGHAASRDDLDLFLYLGDTTYNDGASSLDEYRDKWIESVGRDAYRALRAKTSALATWDDHEFDNNFNPETFDAGARAAAVRTFFEHQPLRRDPSAADRVWKSARWGSTAEIFVLDSRNERRPSTRTTAEAEYLSRAQMDWLKAGLDASQAVFKIVVTSVPIANFPGLFDFAIADRWEGYAAQREEILRFIDDRALTGVLWVAGDFHLASAQRVSTSGPGSTQVEVLVGPGAQNGNVLASSLGAPQFDFATRTNNYSVLELDPTTTRARIYWIDGDGGVIETLEYDLG